MRRSLELVSGPRPAVPRLRPRLSLVLAASLCCAFAAQADGVPEQGEGTVAILGGFRLIPQHGFLSQVQSNGGTISQKQFQPQGIAYFGFMPDEQLHITIGLGYGIDRYSTSDGDLSVSSFTLLLGADTPLLRGDRYTVYGGGGIGYSLNTLNLAGVSTESNSTAGYLAVGFRYALGSKIALVVEDRYTVASAAYPHFNASVNVGGNLLSAGLLFHFFSPEDKGHPHAPGD
jgi:Outer membrane protein beta-barrel domain